jgi:hypothetical protein
MFAWQAMMDEFLVAAGLSMRGAIGLEEVGGDGEECVFRCGGGDGGDFPTGKFPGFRLGWGGFQVFDFGDWVGSGDFAKDGEQGELAGVADQVRPIEQEFVLAELRRAFAEEQVKGREIG